VIKVRLLREHDSGYTQGTSTRPTSRSREGGLPGLRSGVLKDVKALGLLIRGAPGLLTIFTVNNVVRELNLRGVKAFPKSSSVIKTDNGG